MEWSMHRCKYIRKNSATKQIEMDEAGYKKPFIIFFQLTWAMLRSAKTKIIKRIALGPKMALSQAQGSFVIDRHI